MSVLPTSPVVTLVGGFEDWQLEALIEGTSPSIEAFLEDLEDQLERGEISMDDVVNAIKDFHRCK